MADNEIEIPLEGGNVNAGVVRKGDTVRRAISAQSGNVHLLLTHLEAKGFDAAPRFLGVDVQGREILSYIDGESGYPEYLWQNNDALIAAARMLRSYHDATVDFMGGDLAAWAYRYPDSTKHEVIGHNDFAIYNMIYRNGMPIGIIDFDLAGPAPRLRDLAYLAYWFGPLSFSSDDMTDLSLADLANGSARLKLVCETYGVACDGALLDMVFAQLVSMGDEVAAISMIGEEATARLKDGGHLDHWQREAVAFEAQMDQLRANISKL